MTKSGIQWTDRSDWNPLRGCTRVSPGCVNCYAEVIAGRFSAPGQPFHGFAERTSAGARWTGKVELIENRLTLPLRWRKPARIFVNSAFDLFHEAAPDEVIDHVFAVMALAPQHTFQVLTKRSARMREYLTEDRWMAVLDEAYGLQASGISSSIPCPDDWPLPNVWLGVSVEDQQRADERVPDLLATPAAVRWLSCEPLLGPVDLTDISYENGMTRIDALAGRHGILAPLAGRSAALDWIVAGGESGKDARPMHPDWARSLRDQCQAAGVPFFFKQWGEWAPPEAFGATQWGPVTGANGDVRDWLRQYVICGDDRADSLTAHSFTGHATDLVFKVGKTRAGRLIDGREWNGFPAARRA